MQNLSPSAQPLNIKKNENVRETRSQIFNFTEILPCSIISDLFRPLLGMIFFRFFKIKLYPQQPFLQKSKHCCAQSNNYSYTYSQSMHSQSLEAHASMY